jgi:RPA family protein
MIVQMFRTNLQYVEKTLIARGFSLVSARIEIAKYLKIGPGTYERLIRPDRVKRVDADVWERLKALVIQEAGNEIARHKRVLEEAERMAAAGAKTLTEKQIRALETLSAEMVEIVKNPPE